MIDFVCCGVKYSKSDPITYIYINTDIVSPATKKFVDLKINKQNKKISVKKEIVEILNCVKNGCMKIKIKRYGSVKGNYQLLEIEDLKNNIHTGTYDIETGKEVIKNPASEYLEKTKKNRSRRPQICPLKNVHYSKNIPLSYGKAINSTSQRARYIDVPLWSSDKILKFPVVSEKF